MENKRKFLLMVATDNEASVANLNPIALVEPAAKTIKTTEKVTLTADCAHITGIAWYTRRQGETNWFDKTGAASSDKMSMPDISYSHVLGAAGVYEWKVQVTNSYVGEKWYDSNISEITVEYSEPNVIISSDKTTVAVTPTQPTPTVDFTTTTRQFTETQQWMIRTPSTMWTDITGATGTETTVTFTKDDDGLCSVKLHATGIGGTYADSNVIDITVEVYSIEIAASETDIHLVDPNDEKTSVLTATCSRISTLQWQKQIDGSWEDIPGEVGETMTVTFDDSSDVGEHNYRCIGGSAEGQFESNVETIKLTKDY